MEDLGVTKKDDLDKNETESVRAISIDEEMAILERELTPVEISPDSIKSKNIRIRNTKERRKQKRKIKAGKNKERPIKARNTSTENNREKDICKKWGGGLMFALLFLYYEIAFHVDNFKVLDSNICQIIAFSLVCAMVCTLVSGIFPRIVNKIIATLLVLFCGIFFLAQTIYHMVFNNYLSLVGTLKFGNQAADNAATVVENIKAAPVSVILMVVPMIVGIVLIWTVIPFEKRKAVQNVLLGVAGAVVYIATVVVLFFTSKDVYSPYKIYKEYTSVDLSVQKLGVSESLLIDIREGIMQAKGVDSDISFSSAGDMDEGYYAESDSAYEDGNPESSVEGDSNQESDSNTDDNTNAGNDKAADGDTGTDGASGGSVDADKESAEEDEGSALASNKDTSANVLNIDFDEVNSLAGSSTVEALSTYFESLSPTYKNEYTGMFSGYNVIWITAEGYSGYALDSGLYPTLSKLTNEGFVFENYYQPLWYGSTLGGEYANLMGSPTKNGGYLSMCKAAGNENGMLFSLANVLGRNGYTCTAFHDNDYTYYDRNITHPALGFDWVASGHGLDYQKNENGSDMWPQSDLEMLNETFEKYSKDEPFFMYYLTVSGHVPYSNGGNSMSLKNSALVEALEYSDTTKAYLAAQYELEFMLEELIDKLEENDLLDSTLIVLAGDHVPYDNMEILDEIEGRELEDNFEAYKSHLIIWSAAMENPVKVSKVCSSIDILPTVLNLMGQEYDSRLIIGKDILSASPGLVLFANRSFITDTYEYNANTSQVTLTTSYEVSNESVENMKLYVADKFTAADSITESGYYTYVAKMLGIGQ